MCPPGHSNWIFEFVKMRSRSLQSMLESEQLGVTEADYSIGFFVLGIADGALGVASPLSFRFMS
jgi:hypothetical protein